MNWVGLITNKNTQSIKVISTHGDESITKMYGLTGLVLEPKSE